MLLAMSIIPIWCKDFSFIWEIQIKSQLLFEGIAENSKEMIGLFCWPVKSWISNQIPISFMEVNEFFIYKVGIQNNFRIASARPLK